MATFSTNERKRRPRGDLKSTEMTLHLKQAMQASIKTDLYPYSQIDIYLEVFCNFFLPFIDENHLLYIVLFIIYRYYKLMEVTIALV